MDRHKRYVVGGIMILLQYIMFRAVAMSLDIPVSMRNVSFFLYVFLYLKDDIYSFKTCLIWEELKKQLKCYGEYIVIISIIQYHTTGIDSLWRYLVLGTIALVYSFLVAKLMRITFFNYMRKNVVVVGVGQTAKELGDIISKNRFTMYNFLGFADVNKNNEISVDAEKVVADRESLKDFIKENKVKEVIVALPNISNKDLNLVVDEFEDLVKRVKIIPRLHKMYTFNPEIQDYDGLLLISAKNNIMSLKRRIMKRAFDICGALVGMVLLVPLYIKYGLQIKKDGGPALFSHNRIGRDLEPFKMHKFRSMYIDAEDRLEKMLAEDEAIRNEFYTNFKLKNDPRITPAGAFLRKTSLDEFPQFLNVLKGEMSLVGPRPVVQKEVDMYYGTEMGKKIFQVKPGITGMWQANGRSDVEDYDERIALDLYYIRNWSLWLDIIILIKTVKNVIGKKGAY
ncbi:sugar transferase [uncultured Cetobacterium sp.]|uniref:sugar transferase n=1 Tax=uncultured Cetobacterium sp. TaxID=527638 RepID=UPI0025D06C89|nr:sugar transferase [uncultured Cetobacterium sp.]